MNRWILNKLQLKAIINEEWKNIRFEKQSFNRYRMYGTIGGNKVLLGVHISEKEKMFIEQILKGMEY